MDKIFLERKALETRRNILKMIYNAKIGHIGGSLSSADILTALYFDILNIDPTSPKMDNRDYFILSKGHSVEAYLSVLAERGFIKIDDVINNFCKFGSPFIGHPSNKIPGIEMNTGALGHGLPIGVGIAIGLKKQKRANRVFVLMGDGEQAEGSIWEALMAGANYHLDNLVAITDRNKLQISGSTEDVMALESLKEKYKAFGWETIEIDGHNMDEICSALNKEHKGKPLAVIANTIKGKGISEIENVASWHHGIPDENLFNAAMKEFDNKERMLYE